LHLLLTQLAAVASGEYIPLALRHGDRRLLLPSIAIVNLPPWLYCLLNAVRRDKLGFMHYKVLLLAYHNGYITCLWRYLFGLYLLGNVDFQIPRGGAVSL
jgi:hypothetical protein